jgi:hypothetical protein
MTRPIWERIGFPGGEGEEEGIKIGKVRFWGGFEWRFT